MLATGERMLKAMRRRLAANKSFAPPLPRLSVAVAGRRMI
jgi:hypothetical protein